MEPGAFIVLLLVSVAGSGIGLYQFVRNLRRARAVRDTPRSKIRSAAQGHVELHGRAEPSAGGALISGLAGRPCVWFRFTVEKRQHGEKNEWSTIERHQSGSPFRIADETGSCVVDPAGASISAVSREQWHGNDRRPDRAPSDKVSWWRHLTGFGYRYTEEYICPGDPTYVIGELSTANVADEPPALTGSTGVDPSPVTTVARSLDHARVFLIAAEGEDALLRSQQMKAAAAAALFVAGLLATAAIVMVMRVEYCWGC